MQTVLNIVQKINLTLSDYVLIVLRCCNLSMPLVLFELFSLLLLETALLLRFLLGAALLLTLGFQLLALRGKRLHGFCAG